MNLQLRYVEMCVHIANSILLYGLSTNKFGSYDRIPCSIETLLPHRKSRAPAFVLNAPPKNWGHGRLGRGAANNEGAFDSRCVLRVSSTPGSQAQNVKGKVLKSKRGRRGRAGKSRNKLAKRAADSMNHSSEQGKTTTSACLGRRCCYLPLFR